MVKSKTHAIAFVAALAVLAGAGRSRAEDVPTPPNPLTLGWALERASGANPEIAEQNAVQQAAAMRVVPAGSLEDPRFSYQASNIPVGDLDFRSTPLSGNQLGLKQRIPFPGLLRNRRQAAEAALDAAGADVEDRERRIAGVVEQRWAALGFAQRAIEITERNIDLLRQLTKIAEVKYSVGTGLQQDVLRSQVALTNLLDERLRREAAVEGAAAALTAVLDLPPDTIFPPTADLADSTSLPEIEPLLASLEATSPMLAAAEARIEEAKRLVRATTLESYPDFDIGVSYRFRESVMGDPVGGDDFLGAGVTIRLPVNRRKWDARVAERRAMVRRAEAQYRGARSDLRARVRSTHADLVRADSQAELLETGLVPQARQSLDSSRSGYEVGRVDFLSLLDSQVRLLDAELRHVRTLADRRSAFAALEAELGETLR